MGGDEVPILVGAEPTLKYHPCAMSLLTTYRESGRGTVLGGQFDWAVSSQSVTEEFKGTLSAVGNRM